jgi:hypothetical protein
MRLGNLIVAHLLQKFPALSSRGPVTGSYPEPYEFITPTPSQPHLFKIIFIISVLKFGPIRLFCLLMKLSQPSLFRSNNYSLTLNSFFRAILVALYLAFSSYDLSSYFYAVFLKYSFILHFVSYAAACVV